MVPNRLFSLSVSAHVYRDYEWDMTRRDSPNNKDAGGYGSNPHRLQLQAP